jgi:hypothetical protein
MRKIQINLVMVSQVISMLLVIHAIYLLLGLEMVFIYQKIFLFASGLPIVASSVLLLFFALHLLLRKKLIPRLLLASAVLSWAGCVGWLLCHRAFDHFNDWGVFYSPVFWFPIFLLIYFSHRNIKKQFLDPQSA